MSQCCSKCKGNVKEGEPGGSPARKLPPAQVFASQILPVSYFFCEPRTDGPFIPASGAGVTAPTCSNPPPLAAKNVPTLVDFPQLAPGSSQVAPSRQGYFYYCTPAQLAVIEQEEPANFPDVVLRGWRPPCPCTGRCPMVFTPQPNVDLWNTGQPSKPCCLQCYRYRAGDPIFLVSPSLPRPPHLEREYHAELAGALATRDSPGLPVYRYPAGPSGEDVYPATTTHLRTTARAAGPLADPCPLETTVPPSLGRGSTPSPEGYPAGSSVSPTPAPKPSRPFSKTTVSPAPPRKPVPPPPIRLEDRPAQSSKPPPPPPTLPKSKASFPRNLRRQDEEACAATKKPGFRNSSKEHESPPWETPVTNPDQQPNGACIPKDIPRAPPPERVPRRPAPMNNDTVPLAQIPPKGNCAVPPAQLQPAGNGAAAPNAAMDVGQRGIPYAGETFYYTPQQIQHVIQEKQRRYPGKWERKWNPPWICAGECGVCWMERDAVYTFSNRGLPWCQRCCGVLTIGSVLPSRVGRMPLPDPQSPIFAPTPTDASGAHDAPL